MPAADSASFDAPFLALAHRGGFCPAAPPEIENSLRAFQAAWDLGYTHMETDVHVTRDGALIAFHDDALDRVTDHTGRVADLSRAEVALARIGGTEPIPTLDELLDALPQARFNIDLKASGAVAPLAETLRRHGAERRVCVASFSGSRLAAFRRLTQGRVATSASPLEVAVFAWKPAVRRVWPLRAQVFQLPEREVHTGLPLLRFGLIGAAHRRGAAVHVWTVNERATMERLIDAGVDGLVTDDIVTLKSVLIERDLWEGHA